MTGAKTCLSRPSGRPIPPRIRLRPAVGWAGIESPLKRDVPAFLQMHAFQKVFQEASTFTAPVGAWEGKTWLQRGGIETRCAVAGGAV